MSCKGRVEQQLITLNARALAAIGWPDRRGIVASSLNARGRLGLSAAQHCTFAASLRSNQARGVTSPRRLSDMMKGVW